MFLHFISFITTIGVLIDIVGAHIIDIVGPTVVDDVTSNAQFISSFSSFDTPKVRPITNSSFDWWYFDAVSADQEYSVTVIFFTAPQSAFPFVEYETILPVYLFVSVPGDPFFLAEVAFAQSATIITVGDGASGCWEPTGFQFCGNPDMSVYRIDIASPTLDIGGSLVLDSVAPAHYPCASLVLVRTWSCYLILVGQMLFQTPFWADQPMQDNVASWYWGHGRLGPYSIVWFDIKHLNGTEYTSGYVSKGGKVLSHSCHGVKVRPTGNNSTYPPTLESPMPSGYHVEIYLGRKGKLEVDVSLVNLLLDVDGLYTRWAGSLSGGIKRKKKFKGTSICEQFVLIDADGDPVL
ncbi:MAG: hypothetical protein M1834_005701 [Cirrosporium novae-zelandiae]|nr:MAG: hypothetical protein M1834_005701 [Cirrosporium novae-zelandiae]